MVNIGIVPLIFTPGIKFIASCSKLSSPYPLFVNVKTVFTSHGNNLFGEWVNKFYLDEASARIGKK